jgi:CS domain
MSVRKNGPPKSTKSHSLRNYCTSITDFSSIHRQTQTIHQPKITTAKSNSIKMSSSTTTTSVNDNDNAKANAIFENEEAMIKQLQAMGMPRQMLENLTPQQKKAMFALTTTPEIQRRAEERVKHEDEWKKEKYGGDGDDGNVDIMWKNTRDDVFIKFLGIIPSSSENMKEQQVQCIITPTHLKVVVPVADDGGGSKEKKKVVVDNDLFQTVIVDESTWKLEDDESDNNTTTRTLVVCLRKSHVPMRWLTVFR